MLKFSLLIFIFSSFPIISIEKGPLEIKNTYPPVLIFLFPTPSTPSTLKKGEFLFRGDFIQSNIFQIGGEFYKTQVIMDMEVSRSALNLQYGLTDKLEFGLEIPFLYYSRGIADEGIQAYHNTFGFPNSGRELMGNFSFSNKISYFKLPLVESKSRSDFGDSTIHLKWKISDEKKFLPMLSVAPILELPTGNNKYLMGNGKSDAGGGILIRKIINDFSFYGNFYYISIGESIHSQNIKIRPFIWTFVYTVVYKWSDKLSILAQINDSTSPYKSSEKKLDSYSSLFSAGFKYSTSEKMLFALSFSEDFSHKTTPDVTLNFSFSYLFGELFNDKDKKIIFF